MKCVCVCVDVGRGGGGDEDGTDQRQGMRKEGEEGESDGESRKMKGILRSRRSSGISMRSKVMAERPSGTETNRNAKADKNRETQEGNKTNKHNQEE